MPFKSKAQQRSMCDNKSDISELGKQAALVTFVKTSESPPAVADAGAGGVMGLPPKKDMMAYAPQNVKTESPLNLGEEGRFADLRSHGRTKERYKPYYNKVTSLARKTNPELDIRRLGPNLGSNPGGRRNFPQGDAYATGQERANATRNAYKHLYGDFQ